MAFYEYTLVTMNKHIDKENDDLVLPEVWTVMCQ